MEARLSQTRRTEIIQEFEKRSVLVVGDLMIDEYLRGNARRISQESPVMVVEVEADEFKPGGAANVGNNLRALGARVVLLGVVGNDEMGRLLRTELSSEKIDVSGMITDPARPTTRKTRIVAQNQQVLRVDRELTQPISHEITRRLLERFEEALPTVNAVLVSDYRKGVVTRQSARMMCELAKAAGKPLVANPKPASAPWLKGARLLSLNQIEAEELGRAHLPAEDAGLQAYGQHLVEELDVEALLITRGARGLCLWLRGGAYYPIPAHLVEVADIAGAGDTTISTMTLALASGAADDEAAEMANLAGACVVRKLGVATITPDELLHAV